MGHILSYLQSRPPSDLLIDFTSKYDEPSKVWHLPFEFFEKEMFFFFLSPNMFHLISFLHININTFFFFHSPLICSTSRSFPPEANRVVSRRTIRKKKPFKIKKTDAKPNTTKSDTYEALKKEMVRGYKLLQSLKDYKDGGKSVRRRVHILNSLPSLSLSYTYYTNYSFWDVKMKMRNPRYFWNFYLS